MQTNKKKGKKKDGKHFKEALFPPSSLNAPPIFPVLITSARINAGITNAGPLLSPGLLNCGEKRQTFHHFSTDALIPFFKKKKTSENEGLLKEEWVFFI